MLVGALRGQETASDALELRLLVVDSTQHRGWEHILGLYKSSGCALNHRASSPAPSNLGFIVALL